MRVLGLLGGTTYHATLIYYKEINDHVQKTLGGGHSSKLVLHSFDYAELVSIFQAGDYDEVSRQLCTAAKNLKSIGAEAIVLCVNTNHRWAEDIENATGLPLLHIIDFTGDAIIKAGLKKIALLGTKIVMEQDFLKKRLENKHGIQVLVPESDDTKCRMNDIIFQELSMDNVTKESKQFYLDAVRELFERGAEGVILGCTELQMILKPGDVEIPLFDTVELHAKGVARWQLEN
ncbi:aspartate glutamate racemase [Fusarium longipes]|uniref:Aspartate glutamate racemase n=1 Tax=Fusarium longipes TaxID=694270 RepID=A0A395SLZ3_9HYPO|nr:aspartate glutamate racemase [Fusarium longipes]